MVYRLFSTKPVITWANSLSPIQQQANTWTNADLFSIGHFNNLQWDMN